jgi:hypothetical protein
MRRERERKSVGYESKQMRWVKTWCLLVHSCGQGLITFKPNTLKAAEASDAAPTDVLLSEKKRKKVREKIAECGEA